MSFSNEEEILRFWFGEPPLKPRGKLWWQGGEGADETIRNRFGDLVEQALDGALDHWADTPRGALALVILLDQFTRNSYRGTGKAFAGDPMARGIVDEALWAGVDRELHPLERSFFYLPLEHAESLATQDRAIAAFRDLLEEAPAEYADYLRSNLDYARQHREVIARFGRFPHRNKALGRESTEAEAAYLASGGKRFGQ